MPYCTHLPFLKIPAYKKGKKTRKTRHEKGGHRRLHFLRSRLECIKGKKAAKNECLDSLKLISEDKTQVLFRSLETAFGGISALGAEKLFEKSLLDFVIKILVKNKDSQMW